MICFLLTVVSQDRRFSWCVVGVEVEGSVVAEKIVEGLRTSSLDILSHDLLFKFRKAAPETVSESKG